MSIFAKPILSCIKGIFHIMWLIWIPIRNNHLHKTKAMSNRSSTLATIIVCNRIDYQALSWCYTYPKIPLLPLYVVPIHTKTWSLWLNYMQRLDITSINSSTSFCHSVVSKRICRW
eukprot:Gb_24105 [translate_table: standard]